MDNIFYLTGFRGSEGTVLVTRGDVVLLMDSRYITHAREVAKAASSSRQKERTPFWRSFRQVRHHENGLRQLSHDFQTYRSWREGSPAVEFVPVSNDIESIRRCKEPEEIAAMQKAIGIATEAFTAVFDKIVPGRTEKEIANELDYAMRQPRGRGARPSRPSSPRAPRSALPHGRPTDKTLEAGEVVIIDFGCRVDGYCSDETCTLSLGQTSQTIAGDPRNRA